MSCISLTYADTAVGGKKVFMKLKLKETAEIVKTK